MVEFINNLIPKLTSKALAQGITPQFGLPGAPANQPTSVDWLITFYKFLFGLGIVATIISLVVAGVMYIFGGASPVLVKKAQRRIYMSLIGLVLLLSSNFLINQINPRILKPEIPLKIVKTLQQPPGLFLSSIGKLEQYEIINLATLLGFAMEKLLAKQYSEDNRDHWEIKLMPSGSEFANIIKGAIYSTAVKNNTTSNAIIENISNYKNDIKYFYSYILLSAIGGRIMQGSFEFPVTKFIGSARVEIKNTIVNISSFLEKLALEAPDKFNIVTSTVKINYYSIIDDVFSYLAGSYSQNVFGPFTTPSGKSVKDILDSTINDIENNKYNSCLLKDQERPKVNIDGDCKEVYSLQFRISDKIFDNFFRNLTSTISFADYFNQLGKGVYFGEKRSGSIGNILVNPRCTDTENLEALFFSDQMANTLIRAVSKLQSSSFLGSVLCLYITEAFPPGYIHKDRKHYDGRAIDISYRDLKNKKNDYELINDFATFIVEVASDSNIEVVAFEFNNNTSDLGDCLENILQIDFNNQNVKTLKDLYNDFLHLYGKIDYQNISKSNNICKAIYYMLISSKYDQVKDKIKFAKYPHVVGEPLHIEAK